MLTREEYTNLLNAATLEELLHKHHQDIFEGTPDEIVGLSYEESGLATLRFASGAAQEFQGLQALATYIRALCLDTMSELALDIEDGW